TVEAGKRLFDAAVTITETGRVVVAKGEAPAADAFPDIRGIVNGRTKRRSPDQGRGWSTGAAALRQTRAPYPLRGLTATPALHRERHGRRPWAGGARRRGGAGARTNRARRRRGGASAGPP